MQHVSLSKLQKPLHPLLPEYLSEAHEGEKVSEVCISAFLFERAKTWWYAIFKENNHIARKKKQSAFHMWACKTAQEALTRG